MSDTNQVLQARQVTKHFAQGDTKVPVLLGVDLAVAPGERVAIVGRSGSGKSSLLHILAGLEDAQTGQVFIAGRNMGDASSEERASLRREHLGFVYQQHHLLPEFTALENVSIPQRLNGVSRDLAEQASRRMLQRVGLEHRLSHVPAALSGGERQRVAVARALVHHPRLVLADEPTGNLDQRTAQELFTTMHELSRSEGIAFLVVTHDITMLDFFDRRLSLNDGVLQPLSSLESQPHSNFHA